MLERGSAPKRFFEFVGDVRADKDAFPIRHDSVWTPDLLTRGRVLKEQAYKPNFVPARKRATIIHLGRRLPDGSSDLPGNAASPKRRLERATQNAFPYLVLHHEEFA